MRAGLQKLSGMGVGCTFLAVCAALVLVPALVVAGPDGAQRSKEAYVSLLYGDAFLLGIRVLGQSLRETGTERCVYVKSAGPAAALRRACTSSGGGVYCFFLTHCVSSMLPRDLLAVTVGAHVSQSAKNTLRSDGWIVQEVRGV